VQEERISVERMSKTSVKPRDREFARKILESLQKWILHRTKTIKNKKFESMYMKSL